MTRLSVVALLSVVGLVEALKWAPVRRQGTYRALDTKLEEGQPAIQEKGKQVSTEHAAKASYDASDTHRLANLHSESVGGDDPGYECFVLKGHGADNPRKLSRNNVGDKGQEQEMLLVHMRASESFQCANLCDAAFNADDLTYTWVQAGQSTAAQIHTNPPFVCSGKPPNYNEFHLTAMEDTRCYPLARACASNSETGLSQWDAKGREFLKGRLGRSGCLAYYPCVFLEPYGNMETATQDATDSMRLENESGEINIQDHRNYLSASSAKRA